MSNNVLLLALSAYNKESLSEVYKKAQKQHQLEKDYLDCENKADYQLNVTRYSKDELGPIYYYQDYYQSQNASGNANIFTYQTNEPGTKAILNKLEGKLDYIIILASETVMKAGKEGAKGGDIKYYKCLKKEGIFYHLEKSLFPAVEETGSCTFDFYIDQIRHYVSCFKNKEFPEVYVLEISDSPLDIEVNNCCIAIAQFLISIWDKNKQSRLFLETNGGPRDTMTVLIGTLRAIAHKGILPEYAAYSYFGNNKQNEFGKPMEIMDKRNSYRFFDLVSGLDDFLSVGRSERLIQYFKREDQPLPETLLKVQNLSRAFSLCLPDGMLKAVKEVAESLHDKMPSAGGMDENELYNYVIDEIKKDIGEELLEYGNKNSDLTEYLIPIMEWALKKGYIQQVITLYAEKMPEVIVRKGILYYTDTATSRNGRLSLREDMKRKMSKNPEYTEAYVFIQKYLCTSPKNNDPICYQELLKKGKSAFLADYLNQNTKSVDITTCDLQAYKNGTFIEKVLSSDTIEDFQRIHSELSAPEVAELMRIYYSIKKLRNSMNHANTSTKSQKRFDTFYMNYENYDKLKEFLGKAIEKMKSAIQFLGNRRDDL